VDACPPSSAYRLRKLLRRHKVSATTALLVAASLVLGTAISIWQAAVARHAQAQAAARLVAETQARQEASAISELLQEGLASANPDTARGSDYTVRQLLDQISARLGDQLRDQPAAEAAIRATIGNAYFRLGLPEQAAPHLKRALELRERLFGPDHPDVARSLYDEAWNLQEYGDPEGAEARVRRALGIHQKAGLRTAETVRFLWLLQLILRREGREAESEHVGKDAAAMARQLPDAGPELANILHTLAESARLLRRDLVGGERLARESLALHRRFRGGDHPQTARALNVLGIILAEENRYDEAAPCLRESIAVFEKHFGYINEGTLPSIAGLMMALRAGGDTAGLESLRADVAARARSVLRDRPNDAGPLFYAALALAIVGDTDGAVELYSAAAAADGGSLKVWYKRIDQLAWLLAVRPDPQRRHAAAAMDLAQQAVALAPRDPIVWMTLGAAHYRAGRFQAALESLTKSLELQPSDETPACLFLAMTHWHLGNRDEARRWYDRAAERIDKAEAGREPLTHLRREAAQVLGVIQQTRTRADSAPAGDPPK
jgi:tetratricopeptide (TPR) repeat protein